MTIWRPHLGSRSGPKYKVIAQAIGESIANGSLKAGTKLPPQRDLAYDLGLSLNTVSRAYAEAIRRGFLLGEVGRGTYVRPNVSPAILTSPAQMTRSRDGPIDFSLNLPAPGEGATVLAEALAGLKASPDLASLLDYQTGGDLVRHARAGAAWLNRFGLETSHDDVILTNGAQHGLMVALLATLRPGDVLLTEATTYAPIKAMASHLGLRLIAVAMDGGGLLPEALDEACRTTAAKALYCLPTLHTPTTITMTAARRRDIAAVARRRELLVIEDDVFGLLPPDRPPPLARYAPDQVLFVTSVSKSLAPGLRVGFLHAPPRLGRAVRAAVNLSCWMPPPLMAELVSGWVEDGTADQLNGSQRSEAQARQTIARGSLGAHQHLADPSGLHLWLSLPRHWRADAFRLEAERRGVKVLTGETFAVERRDAPQAIRLCLSHEPTRDRVTRGLEIIAELLDETRDPGALVV